jgi:hypothetical protein
MLPPRPPTGWPPFQAHDRLINCRSAGGALQWCMPKRQQKISLGEMREAGVRGLLIYCADYHCSHSTVISADLRDPIAWAFEPGLFVSYLF